MPKKLHESVIVITGASSGIGRAAAIAFAAGGAPCLVVAARRGHALEETAHACRNLGARAIAVPTDVSDEGEVRALAKSAVDAFGGIDVWVNNAAVCAFGKFTEIPSEVFRKVMETNFFGYVHGARAALEAFRSGGSGVLINNASMVARLPEPFASPYVASKHAIRGLAASLRQELRLEGTGEIHVCTVMPAAIDTPFFQHAANYLGVAVKAFPPVHRADAVAEAMVECALRPRDEFFVGNAARVMNLGYALSSRLGEKSIGRMVRRLHFDQKSPAERTDGNIFHAMTEVDGVSGGWTPFLGKRRSGAGASEAKAGYPARVLSAGIMMAALAAGIFMKNRWV